MLAPSADDDDDDDDIHSATGLKQTLSPASVLSVRSDPELTSSPESLLSDYCINNLFDDAITCQDSLETELAVQAQPGLDLTSDEHSAVPLVSDVQQSACTNRLNVHNINHKPNVSQLPTPKWTFPVIWLSNIRGGLCTKLDEITSTLCANNVHIAAITESWLHEGIDDSLTQIPGFVAYRLDREDR